MSRRFGKATQCKSMMERIRVLYAEDDSSDLDLTKVHFQLNAPDCELEGVGTGQRCLARLKEEKFDVLLLDNRLPDMDGIEVLRELTVRDVRMPVVMVTAVGDEALVVQVLRLGALDYVPKQGNYIESLPAVLRDAVAQYRTQQGWGQGAGRRQRRILYVEHHQADIDLTLEHFADSAAHFILEVVHSPSHALALLQEDKFDLVLVDLRMPEMTALDLLREAKHLGLLAPFIIITGQGDEAAAVAALKLGAFDYIIKRDNYLTHLPHAIENAIARSQLIQTNRRLQAELAERERAEAENARLLVEGLGQRQRLDEIIASVPGLVWEAWGRPDDADQKTNFVSNHIERMLGYSVQQWLSTPNFWLSIVHPEDKERAAREAAGFFTSGKGGISQFRWIARDERVVWVEAHSTVICDDKGNPLGMRGVTIDITASKEAERGRAQLEEQLRQAQKIDSIGRLAGGVAHDFNNILTAIRGYAELMLLELAPGDPMRSSVTEIRRAGERAADLTRQLLAFSRRQLLQPRVLALNSLIADSIKMLKRLLGEDIELVTLLDPELGHVKADAGQMDQIILNLALNARDAMPQGGKLTLETRNVVLQEEYAQKHFSLQPGSYIMFAISDIGCGMDSQTLSHIFEPFFTTKEPGKGTGLGLSTVYGIVQQSGGSIWVYSEPGRGTTFKIYLPRIEEPLGEAEAEEKQRTEPDSPRGSETIFVVEDDEIVRKLTSQALRRYGYRVVEAVNGREALLACEKHPGTIPLMITDVVMPQMGGPELADRLRELHPETQVLFMSGYTDDAVVRHGILDAALYFLQKPFTPAALVRKVRAILDQETASPTV
jgi:PAS domain S-box-containing protein